MECAFPLLGYKRLFERERCVLLRISMSFVTDYALNDIAIYKKCLIKLFNMACVIYNRSCFSSTRIRKDILDISRDFSNGN